MKGKLKQAKGITLIALVITIIVLLILAGVSIAMLTGDNGILTQAQRAKTETENAAANEQAKLDEYNQIMDNWINGGTTTGGGDTTEGTLGKVTGTETSNTTVQDSLGNKVVVPAGFKVVNPTDNVENGIVIEDVSDGATAGSQFVWIPVGTIHTSNGEKTITLGRYDFDSTTGEPSAYGRWYTEDTVAEHTYNNTPAKDIEGFISKVNSTGGYYIGRYEARTATERGYEIAPLTQVTVKAGDYVYNYVTQPQASSLSQEMYAENSNFTSDLMNSYAWDTAIVFIQECSGDTDYSRKYSLNTVSLAEKGTNGTGTEDVICNVYDMASNCSEWTTETANSNYPCSARGGDFSNSVYYTACRGSGRASDSDYSRVFRPLLYL